MSLKLASLGTLAAKTVNVSANLTEKVKTGVPAATTATKSSTSNIWSGVKNAYAETRHPSEKANGFPPPTVN